MKDKTILFVKSFILTSLALVFIIALATLDITKVSGSNDAAAFVPGEDNVSIKVFNSDHIFSMPDWYVTTKSTVSDAIGVINHLSDFIEFIKDVVKS